MYLNKKMKSALCFVTTLIIVALVFMTGGVAKLNKAQAETPLKQVAQWTGHLDLTKMQTKNEIATKGYAWFKEAATGTAYGDLEANTLVLDGLNLLSDSEYAIVYGQDDETAIKLSILIAGGSKNTILMDKYSSSCLRITGDLVVTKIIGDGILEFLTTANASYASGIYCEGKMYQESGDIRMNIQGSVRTRGIEALQSFYMNGGKASIKVSIADVNKISYSIRYIQLKKASYVLEPINALYNVNGGLYETILNPDGTYPSSILIEVSPCVHLTTKKINEVDATCLTEGYSGDTVCDECNEEISKGEVVVKLPHENELVGKVEPTCGTTGYTGDTKCKICNTEISKGQTIPQTAHTYGEWVILQNPTADKSGVKVKECSICHNKATELIPAIGGGTGEVEVENKFLSTGDIVAIILVCFFLLLIIVYLCGYFFLYRKHKLDDKKIKVIYSFLPKEKSDQSNKK